MKKVLAVLLTVMMLFGTISFSSSADYDPKEAYKASDASEQRYNAFLGNNMINSDQVILAFDALNGTFYSKLNVYDGKGFKDQSGVTGIYYMCPNNSEDINTNLVPGRYIILPQVTAPAGFVFDGWYSYYDEEIYSPASGYVIPKEASRLDVKVLEFVAVYSPGPVESDGGILNILLGIVNKIAELLNLDIDLAALLSGLFN